MIQTTHSPVGADRIIETADDSAPPPKSEENKEQKETAPEEGLP